MAKAWVGGKKLAYFSLISADKTGLEKKQITNDIMQTVRNNFMRVLFITKYLLFDLISPLVAICFAHLLSMNRLS
jgi:hypothetical protein